MRQYSPFALAAAASAAVCVMSCSDLDPPTTPSVDEGSTSLSTIPGADGLEQTLKIEPWAYSVDLGTRPTLLLSFAPNLAVPSPELLGDLEESTTLVTRDGRAVPLLIDVVVQPEQPDDRRLPSDRATLAVTPEVDLSDEWWILRVGLPDGVASNQRLADGSAGTIFHPNAVMVLQSVNLHTIGDGSRPPLVQLEFSMPVDGDAVSNLTVTALGACEPREATSARILPFECPGLAGERSEATIAISGLGATTAESGHALEFPSVANDATFDIPLHELERFGDTMLRWQPTTDTLP